MVALPAHSPLPAVVLQAKALVAGVEHRLKRKIEQSKGREAAGQRQPPQHSAHPPKQQHQGPSASSKRGSEEGAAQAAVCDDESDEEDVARGAAFGLAGAAPPGQGKARLLSRADLLQPVELGGKKGKRRKK